MRITVLGSGYVGLVAGTCLSVLGNDVICLDLDELKIEKLRQAVLPIYEPGLDSNVAEMVKVGRLRFTSKYEEGVAHADIIFVAVGTPQAKNGAADLSFIRAAAAGVGRHLVKKSIIVIKSTVPVGTAHMVKEIVEGELASRQRTDVQFAVVSNPEFLREGNAIQDFMRPDRIVIGSDDAWAVEIMRRIYAPLSRNHDKLLVMSPRSAELTKYASNAMLATRISFMNELSRFAEAAGGNIEDVRRGIGEDSRIGRHFLYAGAGYGGSCFPKDVRALVSAGRSLGIDMSILAAVDTVNNQQKTILFEKIASFFASRGGLKGKTIAIWGLAFKPDTDDVREAPSLALIERLLSAGAQVRAYDPIAVHTAKTALGSTDLVTFCSSAYEALAGADALALVTEYREFRTPDFDRIAASLTEKAVFDGRNLYARADLEAAGLHYFDIGRGNGV
ncbi:UDP-glucose dehydrogenase family protein [Mesorhizobium retamae]|uniref:UDP-glucose 6-dehydrogenase n=1 Tax=Mesorhizobium retamae TaxID=2912854 RepID=A0ABS9QMT3_9HYPH|nr:UDP-glucose/GDP-mannose dehydrogenase family protein [Mesorhizobium sp. IRAMC:0171]MCG7508153.1 UDP-glucose/GDP-mannose dehydrogenase family protein [Mesorhizobium sp. IRAMC:0171]